MIAWWDGKFFENRYAGSCKYCGVTVEAGKGQYCRDGKTSYTQHYECYKAEMDRCYYKWMEAENARG